MGNGLPPARVKSSQLRIRSLRTGTLLQGLGSQRARKTPESVAIGSAWRADAQPVELRDGQEEKDQPVVGSAPEHKGCDVDSGTSPEEVEFSRWTGGELATQRSAERNRDNDCQRDESSVPHPSRPEEAPEPAAKDVKTERVLVPLWEHPFDCLDIAECRRRIDGKDADDYRNADDGCSPRKLRKHPNRGDGEELQDGGKEDQRRRCGRAVARASHDEAGCRDHAEQGKVDVAPLDSEHDRRRAER